MMESDYDSSDSEIVIMKKCLDVELPPDYDPTKPPETGEEYVQYVMYERKMCKKWVVANNIDRNELEKNQTFSVKVNEGCLKAPCDMTPQEEWQLEQLEKFKEFRKFLNPSVPETPTEEIVHLSHLSDRIKNDIPTFSEIADYSQGSKLKMLEIISDEIESLQPGESIPYNTCIWIFGILSTIAIPLSPQACYSLRGFARMCALVRSNLPSNSSYETYAPLNSFICIVARYFNQLDLADSL